VDTENAARLNRLVLRAFLASIAVNAALGIWALLGGDFGETQGKVLATSFLVSGAMLGVLVNGAAVRRRVLWPLPLVAAVCAAAGMLWFVLALWVEADDEAWFKIGGTLLTVAAGATLAGLLALLGLRRAHEPLRWVADALIAVLCLTVIVVMWAEIDTDWVGRVIGVESVLVAALTLAIPALSRFAPPPPDLPPPGLEQARFCPYCGEALPGVEAGPEAGVGDSEPLACARCGRRFTVIGAVAAATTGDAGSEEG
jgi:hypothetical protein